VRAETPSKADLKRVAFQPPIVYDILFWCTDRRRAYDSDIFRWSPRQFKKAEAAGLFEGSKSSCWEDRLQDDDEAATHGRRFIRLANALASLAPEPAWVVTKEDNVELGTWLPPA